MTSKTFPDPAAFPKFEFRLKLVLSSRSGLQSDDQSIVLSRPEGGMSIILSAGGGAQQIKDASELLVKGGPYSSDLDARLAGQACNSAMKLVCTRLRIGVNFGKQGSKTGEFTEFGLRQLEASANLPVIDEVEGVMVYETNPPPRIVSVGNATIRMLMQANRFGKCYTEAIKVMSGFTPKEELALELYHSSFFETSMRTRFLTLVIAVEALLEPADRGQAAKSHVHSMIKATKNNLVLSPAERQSILGSLSWLRKDSISKTARDYVEQKLGSRKYHGMPAKDFFTVCYNLRSTLVHNGTSLNGDGNVGDFVATLEELVSDLLSGPILNFDI